MRAESLSMFSSEKRLGTHIHYKINVPSAQDQQYSGEVYIITHTLSEISHGSSLLTSPFTVHLQYMYVYSRQRIHTYSFMGSCIRDSAAAVHEAAATLGFTLKKGSLLPLRRDMMSLQPCRQAFKFGKSLLLLLSAVRF